MSRQPDFGIPQAGRGRLAPILIAIPLLLIGIWEIAAPRLAPAGPRADHRAMQTIGGVAARP